MRADRTSAVTGVMPGDATGHVDRVRGEWRMMLPFVFVLVSLALLTLAPQYVASEVNATRERMTAVAAARRLLLHVQSGFAQASAVVRAHIIAPDTSFRQPFSVIMAEERSTFLALDSIAVFLRDDSLRAALAELQAGAARRRSAQEAVLTGTIPPDEYLRPSIAPRGPSDAMSGATDGLAATLGREIQRARARITRTQRMGLLATTMLALLAAVSVIIVLRVAQQFRVRAIQERALREAAMLLTEAYRVDDVLARIATLAAEVDGAESCYVERVRDDGDGIEVAASTSDIAVRTDVTIPYDRSLTCLAAEHGGSAVIHNVEHEAPGILEVSPECGACGALVIVLRTDGDVHGALVLLHERPRRLREQPHVRQSRIFAALASLAVRNAIMLRTAERREAELHRVMDSRDRLIRGFSHDVKNPLGAADGHAALLETGVITEDARRHDSVRRIRGGIGTALGLIDDLLELARAESGHLEIQFAQTQLVQMLRNLIEDFRPSIDQSGHRLEGELPNELPEIVTDPDRVRQILGNLVTNAIKYVPSGGSIRIAASVREGRRGRDPQEWIAISVSDTGPGIPQDRQQQLFREFSRLGAVGPSGTGLGLAISANIARRLGGELGVESTVGKGSTFTLWLPRNPGLPSRPLEPSNSQA